MKQSLRLRIIVVNPPAGVGFAVQQGRTELLAPIRTTRTSLIFEFTVLVADANSHPPRLTGDFAQGPPGGRFVYVNSGTLAGDVHSCWTRRAKVPLGGIDKGLLQEALATPGSVLEAHIAGMAGDGGPACASVPLLTSWKCVPGP